MSQASRIIKHKHTWQLAGLLLADSLLFGATNARTVPSFLLIVGFLLLSATMYQCIRILLALISLYCLPLKRDRRLAATLTVLISGLIALKSIGELSQRDVLVLLPLVILGYLYSLYRTATIKRKQPV